MNGWHFLNKTLRDGSPIPKDGVWLPPIKPRLCNSGYHGSKQPWDALIYAPGNILTYCEYRGGEVLEESDKFCASQRRIICRMDAEELLSYFARTQALSVVHLWDAPDVVLDYLATGSAAARDAARDAASAAARDAASAAASAAARDAASAGARAAGRAAAWDAARAAGWDAARAAGWDAASAAASAAARAAAWDAARAAGWGAARAAAWDAGRAAAWDAARAAAWDAAWAAAWAAARRDFNAAVYECFESVVNADGTPK